MRGERRRARGILRARLHPVEHARLGEHVGAGGGRAAGHGTDAVEPVVLILRLVGRPCLPAGGGEPAILFRLGGGGCRDAIMGEPVALERGGLLLGRDRADPEGVVDVALDGQQALLGRRRRHEPRAQPVELGAIGGDVGLPLAIAVVVERRPDAGEVVDGRAQVALDGRLAAHRLGGAPRRCRRLVIGDGEQLQILRGLPAGRADALDLAPRLRRRGRHAPGVGADHQRQVHLACHQSATPIGSLWSAFPPDAAIGSEKSFKAVFKAAMASLAVSSIVRTERAAIMTSPRQPVHLPPGRPDQRGLRSSPAPPARPSIASRPP